MTSTLFEDPVATYTGTLTRNAEVRHRIVGEGHTVPVLVLDIQTDTALRLPVHIEQPFKPGQTEQCQAAAHRYRKGMSISVDASLLTQRLAVTAMHIHIHDKHQEGTTS